MTEQQYYWEKAEFQDPESHRRHVENYKKGIHSSVAFDDEYMKEAIDELMRDVYASKYYRHDGDAERFELNTKYREIFRLHGMLAGNDIPHVIRRCLNGWQVCYPTIRRDEDCVADAIEHQGSYGRAQDKLEIMGLLTPEEEAYDDVAGYLTAEDVFERMKNHWEAHKNV